MIILIGWPRRVCEFGASNDETARVRPVVIDAATLARMRSSTWRTEAGDLDVLATIRDSKGVPLAFRVSP